MKDKYFYIIVQIVDFLILLGIRRYFGFEVAVLYALASIGVDLGIGFDLRKKLN